MKVKSLPDAELVVVSTPALDVVGCLNCSVDVSEPIKMNHFYIIIKERAPETW